MSVLGSKLVKKTGLFVMLSLSSVVFAEGYGSDLFLDDEYKFRLPEIGNEEKTSKPLNQFGDLTILGVSESGQSIEDLLDALSEDSLSLVDSLEWNLETDGYSAASGSGDLSVEVSEYIYGYRDGVAGTWEYTGEMPLSALVFELSGGEFVAVDAAGLTDGDWDLGAFSIQSGWTCCGDALTGKLHHFVALSAYSATEVPLPASLVLFGSAVAGLMIRRRS